MELPSKSRSWIVVALIVLALVVDQVVKILVKTDMSLYESTPVLSDFFEIKFIENNGMAFGMELLGKAFLTLFRLVAICFLVWLLHKLLKSGNYPFGFIVCVAMILAGAAGNLIDCLFYGEIFTSSAPGQVAEFVSYGDGYGSFMYGRVVDMFHFTLTWPDWMPFVGGCEVFPPVFNFADACISCSVVALLIWYRKYLFKN